MLYMYVSQAGWPAPLHKFHERARLFRLFGMNIGPAPAGLARPAPAPLNCKLRGFVQNAIFRIAQCITNIRTCTNFTQMRENAMRVNVLEHN